ncbi:protein phosphatase 2C domain-containing protein [Catenulispora subtropica]|uniref:PP2C family serine/threonine-protein phosphatase n=1 Tax=Catenulispora subtropica TaxID=450798 RepID=A0ABN2SHE6_9ACTN
MGGDTPAWTPVHATVKGANKKYSQDALRFRAVADGAALLLTVADGHGAAPHRRSHLGSAWAVEEFVRCVTPFARMVAELEGEGPGAWRRLREAGDLPLRRTVCRSWLDRTRLHDLNAPSRGTAGPAAEFGRDRLVPYGSTLLGVLLSRTQVFCWQLGDGDIVLVDENGPPRHLFAETGDKVGDETDSLCGPEPWHRMRTHWQPLSSLGRDRLIMINTDGLTNSFADGDGYVRFAQDVYDRFRAHGPAWVGERLPGWLERAADNSGDDTTLLAAYAPGSAAPRTSSETRRGKEL